MPIDRCDRQIDKYFILIFSLMQINKQSNVDDLMKCIFIFVRSLNIPLSKYNREPTYHVSCPLDDHRANRVKKNNPASL